MLPYSCLVEGLFLAVSGLQVAVAAPSAAAPPSAPSRPSERPPSARSGGPAVAGGGAAIERLGGQFLAEGVAPSWGPHGRRVAFSHGGEVKVLDLETEQVSTLVEPGTRPAWSPGEGRYVAFCRDDAPRPQIWLMDAAGGTPRKLSDGNCPGWSADGKTLFFQAPDGAVLRSVRVGVPDAPTNDVLSIAGSFPAASPSAGRVAFWLGNQLVVMDRGSAEAICRWPLVERADGCPAWSPDEKRLAFAGRGSDGVPGLWVLDVEKRQAARVAAAGCAQTAWSPDGATLALDRRLDGRAEIWTMKTDKLETLAPWAMAVDRATVPEAAADLVGPLHRPQGQLEYIELQQHANRGLAESTGTVPENHLKELPEGEHTFAGVSFRIGKSVIQLASTRLPTAPESAEGIPVDCRAIRLYFLHATQWAGKAFGVPEGTTIGRYRIHYTDGSSVEVPVVCGEDIHDWWVHGEERATRGQVVWVGRNPAVESRKRHLRLFLSVWENRHPEKTVAKLDYVSAMTEAAPFCVAVTAETPAPPDGPPAAR